MQTHKHTLMRGSQLNNRLTDRLLVCVCVCVGDVSLRNLRNFQVPLVSPQHPPHLISGLKGPCGSITEFGSPPPHSPRPSALHTCTLPNTHTHIQSSAAVHFNQAVNHQRVDRSSLAQRIWDAGGAMGGGSCPCVYADEILRVRSLHLSCAREPQLVHVPCYPRRRCQAQYGREDRSSIF